MISIFSRYAMLALAALCVVLSLSTCEYRRQYKSADLALSVQNDAIKQQNEEARRKLADMTAERDALQTKYDTAKAAQEKKDEDFNRALADLRDHAGSTPVRVRCQPSATGQGGGGSTGGVPRAGSGSQADAAGTGFLSANGSRRLNDALIQVEELSRDFNSCQSDLLARTKK